MNNTEENAEKATGRKRANGMPSTTKSTARRPHAHATADATQDKRRAVAVVLLQARVRQATQGPQHTGRNISYDSNVVELAKKPNVDVSSIRMHVEPVVSEPCEPASASAYNYVTFRFNYNVALCSMSDYMRNYIRAVEWRRSSNYSNGYDVEHSLPFTIVLVKCVRVEMPVRDTIQPCPPIFRECGRIPTARTLHPEPSEEDVRVSKSTDITR